VGPGGPRVLHYDVTHKEPARPKQKIFFRVQTRRLAASFDASTRSVTRTGAEIFPGKPRAFGRFFSDQGQTIADPITSLCTEEEQYHVFT